MKSGAILSPGQPPCRLLILKSLATTLTFQSKTAAKMSKILINVANHNNFVYVFNLTLNNHFFLDPTMHSDPFKFKKSITENNLARGGGHSPHRKHESELECKTESFDSFFVLEMTHWD